MVTMSSPPLLKKIHGECVMLTPTNMEMVAFPLAILDHLDWSPEWGHPNGIIAHHQ